MIFRTYLALYCYGQVFHQLWDLRLTGQEIKTNIGSGERDYYIRQGTDLFVLEFKDVVIPTDIKYSGDSEAIKNGTAEKLEKTSNGKIKGISQLLNTIRKIYMARGKR